MGKHRELAKELYSSRIWRTVVFAGAMLGTPGVADAGDAAKPAPAPVPTQAANPPAKPAPAPTASGGAPAAPAQIVAAPAKPDPITTKAAALTTANTERNALLDKLSSVEPKEIDKLKKEIDAKNAQINKLVTELVNLRKPRPRTPPEVRPVGRGFVLA
ncbi:MAG TPA: hypothetical protein VL326_08235 [Kofleriaceae bacterium]|jgi:hypothetical protein|nr:hypothetical protein [Kofleriaceae bacterium]